MAPEVSSTVPEMAALTCASRGTVLAQTASKTSASRSTYNRLLTRAARLRAEPTETRTSVSGRLLERLFKQPSCNTLYWRKRYYDYMRACSNLLGDAERRPGARIEVAQHAFFPC